MRYGAKEPAEPAKAFPGTPKPWLMSKAQFPGERNAALKNLPISSPALLGLLR